MGSDYKKSGLNNNFLTFVETLQAGADPISAQSDILGEGSVVQMDVYETPSVVVVEMDIPGSDPALINVLIQGGWLIVEGVKKDLDTKSGPVDYLCLERYFGSVKRTVKLPEGVDAALARAVYRNGVLKITLPRSGAGSRHIVINGK